MTQRYRPYALAWQAIYSADFTLDQVRQRVMTLARGLGARNLSCLVAYDTRFMGPLFARDCLEILQAHGVEASLASSHMPLPALHHALDEHLAHCALYVSACNRPYYYNGLALLTDGSVQLSLEPDPAQVTTPLFPQPDPLPADQLVDLRLPYFAALREAIDLDLIRRTSLTIFVDAMNGTAAGVVPALLSDSGQTRAIEINREPDPLFGRSTPAPVTAGLNRLKKLVRESDSHLGLAISADGTALALVDKNGEQLDPAETALLIATYMARQYRQRGAVVIPPPDLPSPLAGLPRVTAWEEQTGLRVEGLRDPAERLVELLALPRQRPVVGATSDGEIIIGRYAGYADAILAGLVCIEMVARSGGNLRSLIDAQREQLLKP
ncbi:phosphoglucomutase [Candidatus Chloroploca asiatica]|uniref:Phosphoglucomutase n=1 Tax=Candidatus Chloroploca asiatica TaxID=1506545 RepID=A0A2H3KGX3_9CHLR|nr:phosphoglucomutase [Candidatus Chloroploca asiatica]PDV96994.1 hypothetical protein A9Q02_05515 [Candidatus Chloroploca asiatica]